MMDCRESIRVHYVASQGNLQSQLVQVRIEQRAEYGLFQVDATVEEGKDSTLVLTGMGVL